MANSVTTVLKGIIAEYQYFQTAHVLFAFSLKKAQNIAIARNCAWQQLMPEAGAD